MKLSCEYRAMSLSGMGTSGRPPDQPIRMDEDGFAVPITKKRGRGRPRKNAANDEDAGSVVSSLSKNSYETLTDDDPGEFGHMVKRNRAMKVKKPPPIILHNLNSKKEVDAVLQNIPVNKSNILKRVTKQGTKLFVPTTEEFKSLRSHLSTAKAKFTSYTLHEDMVTRYVMYGLPEHDIDEVRAALTDVLKQQPLEVKQMKINRKSYEDQANYLVYFKKSAGITMLNLKNITGILGYRVVFAKYERGVQPTQCYNCQQYSHASRNCWLDPRCMRCGGPHKSSECSLIDKSTMKIPEDKVKCINCHGNHTSNSKDCPIRIRLVKEREELASKRLNTAKGTRYVHDYKNKYGTNFPAFKNTQFVNNNDNTPRATTESAGISYSNALTGKSTQPFSNSNSLFTPRQLMLIFKDMIRICSTCRTKDEQLLALTAVFEKYMCHD